MSDNVCDAVDMLYTLGVWTVKAGHEEAFVAEWKASAEWTIDQFVDAHGLLLHDRDDPARFISFGPWPNEATIAAWRQAPEFQEQLERMRPHLDDFRPGTFDVVADVYASR